MSYDLNGSTQYFTAAPMVTAAPFWWSCWVNYDNLGGGGLQTVMGLSEASGILNNYFVLGFDGADGKCTFTADDSSGTRKALGVAPVVGDWTHEVGFAASVTDRTLYQDLLTVGTNTTSATPANIDSFSIGVLKSFIDFYFFNGQVAEASIGNGQLTRDDVALLNAGFSAEFLPPTAGLLAYWPLVDDYRDHSGNGHDLTATAAPQVSTDHPKITRYDAEDAGMAWAKDHIPTRVRAGQRALRTS